MVTRVRLLVVVFAVVLLAGGLAPAAGAADPPPKSFTATSLTRLGAQAGDKAATSRLAKSDTDLVARTDSARVSVLVKLDYDAIATYAGGVAGIAPTSPSVTGQPLTQSKVTSGAYPKFVATQEAQFVSTLHQTVPDARVGESLRVVYGGVALTLPANEAKTLVKIPGVVAVQNDDARPLLTDSSNQFIGSPTIWNALGGQATAGKGTLFASLDSGVWPEHPSFAANPALGPAPTDASGAPLECDFGDNPLTPVNDPFACNNKLVGGHAFLETYNEVFPGTETFPDSARDSNGHGTHTSSTAAGDANVPARIFGIDRGIVSGVAPGAWIDVFKVCGAQGCFPSDSMAAVEQGLLDGIDVINFSIGGGGDPFSDPVELAFLDAYAAGVFVSASAGNDGPDASTVEHLGPWVTTVGASTQTRTFTSQLTLTGADGVTTTLTGASITPGISTPLPVVFASAPPYNNVGCEDPAPAGIFTGKIVACERTPGRILKGFNVKQGDAAGMILYNPTLQDIETDNHWLPAVHLADGAQFLAFMAAHAGVTATFTAGAKSTWQGDLLTYFSSRGPGGQFLKPDVTAPGLQILAGQTPVTESPEEGPPGELFQAIAGTSMSSPHDAGAALLLRAEHPTWGPGQIKSALMTTAVTQMADYDGSAVDPFEIGAGRIDLTNAGTPGLTFDETADNFVALAPSPVNAVDLNLPSINAPVMPGELTTTRTAKNVSDHRLSYRVATTAQRGTNITVEPRAFSVRPGESVALKITIRSTNTGGQEFGSIVLTPNQRGAEPALHLPVAFVPQQGGVAVTSDCAPAQIRVSRDRTTCTVTATNNTNTDSTVDLQSSVSNALRIDSVLVGSRSGTRSVERTGVPIGGRHAGTPSIAPGLSPGGYVPLDDLGVTPEPIGDEDIVNIAVPSFLYNGIAYNAIGIDSNGYLVVGGGTAQDNECCPPQALPDPAPPNNVLAPFWSDLDGTDAPGIFAGDITDGTNNWIVVEWRVNAFGTTDQKVFQVWLGENGVQDISFAYDPANLPNADGLSQPVVVGAENDDGSGGAQLSGLPTEDLVVTSTDPTPGQSVVLKFTARGVHAGNGVVTTRVTTPVVPGTTVVTSNVNVVWGRGDPRF